MFEVRKNQKTPNIVEFYNKEYKKGKEPEITLDEKTGKLIIYKTFNNFRIEVNAISRVNSKKERRRNTEKERNEFICQLKAKCPHIGDALRIKEALMDYNWFESGYNRHNFL